LGIFANFADQSCVYKPESEDATESANSAINEVTNSTPDLSQTEWSVFRPGGAIRSAFFVLETSGNWFAPNRRSLQTGKPGESRLVGSNPTSSAAQAIGGEIALGTCVDL
jgi:hypothetical protein